jgi:dTDP-4-dehydrorhamnose reductase
VARLLVLGGSGFLGAHVVRAGLAAGWEVVAASRAPEALHGIPGAEGTAHASLDARDLVAVRELVRRLAPDAVVQCVALPSIAACEREGALATRLNAELPGALAEACAARRARLVHVSTDLVFGGEPPRPEGYREGDPTDPRSAYGLTKAEGERAALAHGGTALVARLPLLVGDSFGRNQGASDALVAAVLRGERPRVFRDEWRSPLDVEVAGRALVELAGCAERGLLHLAGPERVARLELGLRALAAAGIPQPELRVQACTRAEACMAERPCDVTLDAARARALLSIPLAGFAPRANTEPGTSSPDSS